MCLPLRGRGARPRATMLRPLALCGSLLLPVPAGAADLSKVVVSDAGWTEAGSRHTDVGVARLWRQDHPDAFCVRAAMVVDVPVATLLEVATDIPSVIRWSRQGLVVSEVVARQGSRLTYWQYLDTPAWMLVADRYWIAQGSTEALPDGGVRFAWAQVAAGAHPELDAAAHARSSSSVRIPVTVGAWAFRAEGGRAWASYTNCADPGGSLPDWVVRFAASRTVPDNLADLVREAKARAGKTASP